VLDGLDGTPRLICMLLYGSGLRLLECLRLRVKDVDVQRNEITGEGRGSGPRWTGSKSDRDSRGTPGLLLGMLASAGKHDNHVGVCRSTVVGPWPSCSEQVLKDGVNASCCSLNEAGSLKRVGQEGITRPRWCDQEIPKMDSVNKSTGV